MISLRRALFSLLIINLCIISLTGCASKSEYEALQSEITSLREENTGLGAQLQKIQLNLDEMQSKYNALKADYESLKSEYEVVSKELTEIKEVPVSMEQVTLNYSWTYGGLEWTWDIQMPLQLYEYYQELPRPPTTNYSVYVTHPLDDIYVDSLVNKIKEAALLQGYDEFQTVEFAITFVQSLPYTADSVTTLFDEYPRYPLETLVDKGGDCEDTSILLVSLLYSMGYDTVLIMFPEHCAVGVLGGEGIYGTFWDYEGKKYFYIETTDIGWSIGQLPVECEGVAAQIYGMSPTPILTHSWRAEPAGTVIKLEVTIENLGSDTAHDVYVVAGFDAGEDMLWNSEESELFQLVINQSTTVTLFLKPPVNEHTRLVIQIVDDGYAVETSYSEWFDT